MLPLNNPLLDYCAGIVIDAWVWWWLNLWFAKYKIPEQAGDFEKFVGSFSLNGIHRKNLCRPD
jgi:hypothetical protein